MDTNFEWGTSVVYVRELRSLLRTSSADLIGQFVQLARCVDDCTHAHGYAKGHTYLMASGGFLKIGRTSGSPIARARSINGACPTPVVLLAAIPGLEFEPQFHRYFKANRVKLEWFTDVPEIRIAFGHVGRSVIPRSRAASALIDAALVRPRVAATSTGLDGQMTLREIADSIPFPQKTILRLIDSGNFPEPIGRIGGELAWAKSDFHDWVQRLWAISGGNKNGNTK